VTRQHHLESTLRTLKLSGMLETLDARLAQARAGELGHLEFLQILCEDEIARREAASLVKRVRQARFEEAVAIEDFDFGYNPKVSAAVIRDLAALRFVEAGESVILYGPVGVGKTMIAQALGHLACRRGHNVLFAKTSRVLADLAGGHADRTWGTRLRKLARPDLLVLDDFAMRDFTVAQGDDLYELVTERQGRSMVLTSNRSPTDWYPLFPNPVVAESVLDRLVNSAHHVVMEGRSYRPNKRPGRGPAKQRGGAEE
jgi:DNA replication protein DnaC